MYTVTSKAYDKSQLAPTAINSLRTSSLAISNINETKCTWHVGPSRWRICPTGSLAWQACGVSARTDRWWICWLTADGGSAAWQAGSSFKAGLLPPASAQACAAPIVYQHTTVTWVSSCQDNCCKQTFQVVFSWDLFLMSGNIRQQHWIMSASAPGFWACAVSPNLCC